MTTLQSKVAISFICITAILCLLLGGILTGIIHFWSELGSGGRELIISIAAFPLLLLLGFWQGYYHLRMEGGRVNLRGVFRQEDFFIPQVTGYALTYVRIKGRDTIEYLHVGLPGERYFSLDPQYYRNYGELRAALILEKMPDPVLLTKATKYQKWQEFVTYSCIYGFAVVMLNAYMDSLEFKADPGDHALPILGSILFTFLFVLWKCWAYARLPKK
mgnify:CR=1 FL=1